MQLQLIHLGWAARKIDKYDLIETRWREEYMHKRITSKVSAVSINIFKESFDYFSRGIYFKFCICSFPISSFRNEVTVDVSITT
jgi:hypothetical protein